MTDIPPIALIDFSDPENDNRMIENVQMDIIWTDGFITGIHSDVYNTLDDIDCLAIALMQYRNKVAEAYSDKIKPIYLG